MIPSIASCESEWRWSGKAAELRRRRIVGGFYGSIPRTCGRSPAEMIAFAACVGTPAKLAACAAPGLRRVMEPDSVFGELTTDRSIHEAYNEALEHFARADGLEALVLLHED